MCIFAAASTVYLNAGHEELFFDSVHLEDDPVIPHFADALGRFFKSGLRPGQDFSNLTFAANYAWNISHGVPGFDAKSFLIVNVALHALTACLFYVFLSSLIQAHADAAWKFACVLLTVLLFAVHPLHVASVDYIIQRRGILATLFYLSSLWSFLKTRDSDGARRSGWGLLMVLSGILSVKSKTMGLTLPIALWLLYLITSLQAGVRNRRALIAGTIIVGTGTAAAAVLLLSGTIRILAAMPTIWGPWSQFLTQLRVMAVILGFAVLPLNRFLSIDHTISISYTLADPAVLASLAFHAFVLGLAWHCARRRMPAAIAFGLVLFYISFLPWMLLPQPEQLVEYKSYLGVAGLAIALAGALSELKSKTPRMAAVIVLSLGIEALATATVHRNEIFQNLLTLWQDVVQKYPASFRAHNNFGYELHRVGRNVEAVEHYRAAIQLNPRDPQTPYNLYFAHANLGVALLDLNQVAEALTPLQAAATLQPDDPKIQVLVGQVLRRLGRLQDALVYFQKAALLEPNLTKIRSEFGVALMAAGRFDEALPNLQAASAADDTGAEALTAPAWILATHPDPAKRDGPLAVSLAEKSAAQIGRGDGGLLDTLAAAYAEAGRFNDATKTAIEARSRAIESRRLDLAAAIEQRLSGYKQGQPYRSIVRRPATTSQSAGP